MADVRPFRGWRYNHTVVTDPAQVVAPPYDVVSAPQRAELVKRSPYNIIQVELPIEQSNVASTSSPQAVSTGSPQASSPKEKYQRAATTLSDWMRQGVLVREAQPALYLARHHFRHHGVDYRRRSFLARVRLEAWGEGAIKPHEHTNPGPKQDRLELLQACKANVSPVMLLYEDRKRSLASLLREAERRAPTAVSFLPDGTDEALWVVTDPSLLEAVRTALAKEDLYVADGHHRYETALTYRNLVKPASPDDAANFVMAALIAFDDAGLLSLPYHRVARLTAAQAKSLRALAAKHFTVQEHASVGPDQIEEMANAVEQGSVLLALSDGGLKLLTLRPTASARALLPRERSAAWRDLTVAVLHQALLDPALGLDAEAAYKAGALDYLKEPGEALQRLQSGAWQLAVFVPPVPLASLKAVADASDRMPPKSTYFYPKLTTGLVINRLE